MFLLLKFVTNPVPHSFPTRRSSDLSASGAPMVSSRACSRASRAHPAYSMYSPPIIDRKSTRLNSSHVAISYAVFCLKKKKKDDQSDQQGSNTRKRPETITGSQFQY